MESMVLNDVRTVKIDDSKIDMNINFEKEHVESFINCVKEMMNKEEGKTDKMIKLLEEIRNLLRHERR